MTTNDKLIRVGLVGVSASNALAWANSTHLPALLQSPHYVIRGLLNSSVESARAAIEAHGLPETTKAYASIHDLSADPDVDLVVVSVNVAKHYEIAKPALEAGKDVYVEWPIGSNLEQSVELAELAKRKGVRTIVGLQGRQDPLLKVVRELIAGGRVGEVLNVNVHSSTPIIDGEELRGREYLSISEVCLQFFIFYFYFYFYFYFGGRG
jgi:predicted dehydrogenase